MRGAGKARAGDDRKRFAGTYWSIRAGGQQIISIFERKLNSV